MVIKIKSLFFLIFFVFHNLSIAQKLNFINYHLEINKAELQIKKHNYDSAIFIYKDIFLKYPHCFYEDLHNLCLCYLKQNNIQKAIIVVGSLVSKGYVLKDFKNNAFDKLTKTKEWNNFVKTNYKKHREKYIEKQNATIKNRNYIYSICKKDRDVRIIESNENIDSISYIMGKKLEVLFQSKSFPEFMVNKDTLTIRLMVVIRHYNHIAEELNSNCELKKKSPYDKMVFDYNLNKILKEALKNGWISPLQYVAMTVYDVRKSPYGALAVHYNFNNETISLGLYPDSNYSKINIKRKSIGLPAINPSDTNMLKGSWQSYVSFEVLKKAMINCDTCKTAYDYLLIQSIEKHKVRNKYENKKNDFILPNFKINQSLSIGGKEYMLNLRK